MSRHTQPRAPFDAFDAFNRAPAKRASAVLAATTTLLASSASSAPSTAGATAAALLALSLTLTPSAQAGTGKLRLTGGVSSVEGVAGGGLTPWATVGTQATAGEWGASAFASAWSSADHRLQVAGAAVAWNERLEFSFARQRFDTQQTGTALGQPGLVLQQDVLGLKWQLAGDAVLQSDTWMPALAVGLLHKRLDAAGLTPTLQALGARTSGTDFYLSATKLWLAQGLVFNGTLRATKANQGGLLGFGGTGHTAYRLQPEVSVAWLWSRSLALGMEYRAKPDNLNPSLLGEGLKEDDWSDVFVAWAPSKQFSLTAAWVDLGQVVPAVQARRQRGAYVSVQFAF